MTAIEPEKQTKKDAILVCEKDGKAVICFCSAEEAKKTLDAAVGNPRSGASMFGAEGWDAEMLMKVTTNIKDRVHEARNRLQDQIRLRDALDKHGVPQDMALRAAISKALKDYSIASFSV